MNIISINKIVELNKLLLENGINIKIHISDACGKQSMWIEPLDSQPVEENVYAYLGNFFEKERIKLIYSDDKMRFWID